MLMAANVVAGGQLIQPGRCRPLAWSGLLTRVDDAVGDAGRHDVAFAGPQVGLRQDVAIGRPQLDPAVDLHAEPAYRLNRSGSRLVGIGCGIAGDGFLGLLSGACCVVTRG